MDIVHVDNYACALRNVYAYSLHAVSARTLAAHMAGQRIFSRQLGFETQVEVIDPLPVVERNSVEWLGLAFGAALVYPGALNCAGVIGHPLLIPAFLDLQADVRRMRGLTSHAMWDSRIERLTRMVLTGPWAGDPLTTAAARLAAQYADV